MASFRPVKIPRLAAGDGDGENGGITTRERVAGGAPMRGPMGPKGDQGKPGPRGPRGLQGPPGSTNSGPVPAGNITGQLSIANGGTGTANFNIGFIKKTSAPYLTTETITGEDIGSGTVDADRLPVASGSADGIVSTGAQTFAGEKTFSTNPVFNSMTNAGFVKNDNSGNLTGGNAVFADNLESSTLTAATITGYATGNVLGTVNGTRLVLDQNEAKIQELSKEGSDITTTDRVTIDRSTGNLTSTGTVTAADITSGTTSTSGTITVNNPITGSSTSIQVKKGTDTSFSVNQNGNVECASVTASHNLTTATGTLVSGVASAGGGNGTAGQLKLFGGALDETGGTLTKADIDRIQELGSTDDVTFGSVSATTYSGLPVANGSTTDGIVTGTAQLYSGLKTFQNGMVSYHDIRLRHSSSASQYLDIGHDDTDGIINSTDSVVVDINTGSGDSTAEFKVTKQGGTTLATLDQDGDLKLTGQVYEATMPLGLTYGQRWDNESNLNSTVADGNGNPTWGNGIEIGCNTATPTRTYKRFRFGDISTDVHPWNINRAGGIPDNAIRYEITDNAYAGIWNVRVMLHYRNTDTSTTGDRHTTGLIAGFSRGAAYKVGNFFSSGYARNFTGAQITHALDFDVDVSATGQFITFATYIDVGTDAQLRVWSSTETTILYDLHDFNITFRYIGSS